MLGSWFLHDLQGEKKQQRVASMRCQAKWGNTCTGLDSFKGLLHFPRWHYFGEKYLCLLTSIHGGHFICAQNNQVLQDSGRYLSSLNEWDHSSLASKHYPYYWVKMHLSAFFFLFWDYKIIAMFSLSKPSHIPIHILFQIHDLFNHYFCYMLILLVKIWP